MGGGSAAKSVRIAQASLAESQRQYAEQQRKEQARKQKAKANAEAKRQSAGAAYENQRQTDTQLSQNSDYSLLGGLSGDNTGNQDKTTLGG